MSYFSGPFPTYCFVINFNLVKSCTQILYHSSRAIHTASVTCKPDMTMSIKSSQYSQQRASIGSNFLVSSESIHTFFLFYCMAVDAHAFLHRVHLWWSPWVLNNNNNHFEIKKKKKKSTTYKLLHNKTAIHEGLLSRPTIQTFSCGPWLCVLTVDGSVPCSRASQ